MRFRTLIAASLLLVLAGAAPAAAVCRSQTLNPVADVCWQCVFPIQFGGRVSLGGGESPPDNISAPACACTQGASTIIGVTASFWEPARMIETVKDPYCFPALGTSLENPQPGLLAGAQGTQETAGEVSTFQQAHLYVFPVWAVLNLFVDFTCLEQEGFDLAYMTEVDPLWGNDSLAFLINPEALLFGNPAAQAACIADSLAANAGLPLDPLFWCMGSWGSAYPLTGTIPESNSLAANAGLAARLIYKLGREALLYDTATSACGPVMAPIWTKSHYRLQVARPVRGASCIPVGRSDLLWGAGKNPPRGAGENAPDNFLWILARKNKCCIGYSP